jgi:hypothetical protein
MPQMQLEQQRLKNASASPIYGQIPHSSKLQRRELCLPAHLPSALFLLRQHRVAAGSGLGTGLSTTMKYVRHTASGAMGNGLGTMIKCLRRSKNGAAGNGIGTTIKYLRQATAAGNHLATTAKFPCGAAGIGLGSTIKYRSTCLRAEPELPNCAHKHIHYAAGAVGAGTS